MSDQSSVFVRKSSGLVREASTIDSIISTLPFRLLLALHLPLVFFMRLGPLREQT